MKNNAKKILYIVRYPLNENFNLKSKFDGQLAAFRNLNMDVYYLGFDEKHFYLIHNEEKEIVSPTTSWVPMYFHTKVYYDMHQAVKKVLKKIRFDYVYWRGAPVWHSSYQLARKLHSQGIKILYEIPTFVKIGEKPQNILRKAFSVYSSLWETKMMQYIDLFVLIFTGDTIMSTFYGKPAIVIDNGIDVSAIPLRKPEEHDGEIHILALASMSYWHGYDRLIRSLNHYTGEKRIIIHIVGGNDGGMLPAWKQLAEDLGVQDRVIFHGKLFGDDLTKMFDLCDVGVNALAQFRKNLGATSELKVREYTARGLPFLCAVEDPALNYADSPFWLKVRNDESALNMEQIVDFALKMRADKELPARMREYAWKYMTWESLYAPVFEEIEKVD